MVFFGAPLALVGIACEIYVSNMYINDYATCDALYDDCKNGGQGGGTEPECDGCPMEMGG